eukprot:4810255-Amphidinium_carterae.3
MKAAYGYPLTHISGKNVVVLHELHPTARASGKTEECGTADKILTGFSFIKDKAPRTSQSNEAMIWTELQKINAGSPIHGWRDGLVKEAIANLCSAKAFAKKIEQYPLTLKDLEWALDNLTAPWEDLGTKSIFWLGQPGFGRILLVAQSLPPSRTSVSWKKAPPSTSTPRSSSSGWQEGLSLPTSTMMGPCPRTMLTTSNRSLTSWQKMLRSMPGGALHRLGRVSTGKRAPTGG